MKKIILSFLISLFFAINCFAGTEIFFLAAQKGAQPPAAPSPSITAQDSQVTVTWSAVSGATSYKGFKSTTSGTCGGTEVDSITSPWVITGLTNGTTEYVSLKATNANGDSSCSSEVSASPVAPSETSWHFAGTVTTSQGTGGTVNWTNPNNVKAYDQSYATASLTTTDVSYTMYFSNFGFTSSDVPVGSTIIGIAAKTSRKASNSNTITSYVQYIGNKISTSISSPFANKGNKTDNQYWATSEEDVIFGGSSDLWGASWTQADIVNSTWQFFFGAYNLGSSTTTASIDSLQIKVYYFPP
jgi:hypothetical protein